MIAFGAALTIVGLYDLVATNPRMVEMEHRIAVAETNGILSIGVLSRAEQVVGRIEREMRERQQPQWMPLPMFPIPTNTFPHPFYWYTNGLLLTNVVVIQDAQGNWKVQWPTNKP